MTSHHHAREAHMPKTLIEIPAAATQGRAALAEMAKTCVPGQTQYGGKADLLREMRSDIKAMLDKKYTARQIADALRTAGVVDVQPKSITEAVRDLATSPKKKQSHKAAEPTPSLKMPAPPRTVRAEAHPDASAPASSSPAP